MQIAKSKNQFAHYEEEKSLTSLALSQLVLLQSRKRWGIMYMLATVSGLFVPIAGVFPSIEDHGVTPFLTTLLLNSAPLFSATFLIITGMYVLNDLVDSDLDKSSGKKRPISSGQVTKAQAHIFVIATNAVGIILALITFNLTSILIALTLVGIGLMYSLPKICLKDRFVLKTASIAVASMLCLMLGSSYAFNNSGTIHNINDYNYIANAFSPILICIYAALMSGSIIFITSLLNDLGDVEGDKDFGRKTIPVVIGKKNTVVLTIIIAATMIVISWLSFYMLPTNIGLICPILVSLVASMATIKMAEILGHLGDHEFIRKQHKKSMSWHLMLQSALIVGALLFWV
ncbi:MAG TPA: UbiA family prenyltransferase [Candidatus Nitrosopolaris sp.]|nr:UbiA family prenyltransferase [Candidatus Nitrosopolaris sp.]